MLKPWPFFLHESKALPLYSRYFEGIEIEIIQQFNLDLSKLIKVIAKNKDGKWIKVNFKHNYIKKGAKIPVPEMWGRYSNISEYELEKRKENEENNDLVIEYIDHIDIDHYETKTYNETATIKLDSESPTIGVVWMAQNQDAKKYNDLSNYTTSIEGKMHGKNPFITSEIKYSNLSRVSERKHYHFDSIYPKIYFKHTPIDNGYNFYFWNDNPLSTRIGNNVVPKKVGPIFINSKIGDGIYHEDNVDLELSSGGKVQKIKYLEEKEEKVKTNSPTFNPYAIIYVMKRLVFDHIKKGIFVISDEVLYLKG